MSREIKKYYMLLANRLPVGKCLTHSRSYVFTNLGNGYQEYIAWTERPRYTKFKLFLYKVFHNYLDDHEDEDTGTLFDPKLVVNYEKETSRPKRRLSGLISSNLVHSWAKVFHNYHSRYGN